MGENMMKYKQNKVKVLLMDAYCVSHVGNDVLLESSIQLIRNIFEFPEIIVHAKSTDAFDESLQISCNRRLFPDAPKEPILKVRWLLEELLFMFAQVVNMLFVKIPPHYLAFGERRKAVLDYMSCDVAVSIGGEMINDSFRKTLPMYLFMFWFARKCGCKTVIFPQSVGPLRRNWTRWLTRQVCKDLTIISSRDDLSLEELHGLGFRGNLALPSPDVGLAQPWDNDETAREYLSSIGLELVDTIKWIGLTTSAWVEEGVSKQDYLGKLVDGLEALAKERKIGVLVMPANMPVKGNDSGDYDASLMLYKRIKAFCECHITPRQAIPARLFKAIAAQMDIYVSTRMHAAIMSSMAATPTITVNTQRKLPGYMALIGQSEFALDIEGLNGEILRERMEEAINHRDTIRERLIVARNLRGNELDDVAKKMAAILLDPRYRTP